MLQKCSINLTWWRDVNKLAEPIYRGFSVRPHFSSMDLNLLSVQTGPCQEADIFANICLSHTFRHFHFHLVCMKKQWSMEIFWENKVPSAILFLSVECVATLMFRIKLVYKSNIMYQHWKLHLVGLSCCLHLQLLICLVIYLHRVAIWNKCVHLHVNTWPGIFHGCDFIKHHQVYACSVDPQLLGFICIATDFYLVLMKTFTFIELFFEANQFIKIKDMKWWPSMNDLLLGTTRALQSTLEGPNWIYNNEAPCKGFKVMTFLLIL